MILHTVVRPWKEIWKERFDRRRVSACPSTGRWTDADVKTWTVPLWISVQMLQSTGLGGSDLEFSVMGRDKHVMVNREFD